MDGGVARTGRHQIERAAGQDRRLGIARHVAALEQDAIHQQIAAHRYPPRLRIGRHDHGDPVRILDGGQRVEHGVDFGSHVAAQR